MNKKLRIISASIILIMIIVFLCACNEQQETPSQNLPSMPKFSDAGPIISETPDINGTTSSPSPTTSKKLPSYDPNIPSPGEILEYRIEVNIAAQIVTVYKLSDGSIVKQFLCSTGTTSNPTPLGSYQIQRKEQWLYFPEFGNVYGQYTSNITGQIWFHSITYSEKDPTTLSTTGYNNLGKRMSHGCIRMACGDVYWIYKNCPVRTTVDIIEGEANPTLQKKLKAELPVLKMVYDSEKGKNVYWDPTDPSPKNPWNN